MKKRNKPTQQRFATESPVVEAPKQPEPLFTMKMEIAGVEPVILNGLNPMMMSQLRQWFAGTGHYIMEVPVGNSSLMLDRNKIAYVFVSEQVEAQLEEK